MALQNHPALYTGGAVALDSTPFVNFQTKLLAMKQAKDEALDEYYNKLNQSVNPAGVRTQDLPAFNEKVTNWRNFYIQNRDDIKRGGQSQLQYQQMLQDIQGYITQSKNEAEKAKPLTSILLDPEKKSRLTDVAFGDIAAHDLPLGHPQRKSIDLNSVSFNPKEYETKDWDAYWKRLNTEVKRDRMSNERRAHPNDKYSQIDVTSEEYSPAKLKQIGDMAREDYRMDASLQHSFNKQNPFASFTQNPENDVLEKQLNEIHKQHYGQEMQDADDLFAAMAIQKNMQPTVTEKVVENWEERQKLMQENKRINISLNNNSGGSGTVGGNTTGNVFDDVSFIRPGKTMKVEDGIWKDNNGRIVEKGKIFIKGQDIPTTWKAVLKAGGVDPDLLIDGVEANIENGQIQSISNELIGIVTRNATDIFQRKFDTERKGENINFSPKQQQQPKSQPKKTENKTKNDPLGILD